MVDKKGEVGKPELPKDVKASSDYDHFPTHMGIEFIIRFYRLFKGSTIYDRKNFVIDRLAQDCLQLINTILKSEKQLLIRIVRDNFFFNNLRIQMKADRYALLRAFLQEMRKRWIGELEFTEMLDGEPLKDFIYLLSGLEENVESNYLYLRKQLEARGIRSLSLIHISEPTRPY